MKLRVGGFPAGTTRRASVRWLAVLLAGYVVAGCARPGPERLAATPAPPNSRIVNVFVATTRERATPEANVFTTARAGTMRFAEFTMAVPPVQPGQPPGTADAMDRFVAVDQTVLTRPEFTRRLTANNKQDVAVFVHGFNTNFQEAVLRITQMAADTGSDYAPVLFAWPSEAHATGYLADREAAAFSRDHLADLLTSLANNPQIGRVAVVAHSMGGWLAMETLRQLRIAGRKSVLNRLAVVLASPDIDVDVFRQQLAVLGPMRQPMTILVSSDDRALAVSSRLAGSRARIGALDVNDPRVAEAARQARVRVIDISALETSDTFNHDRHVRLAAFYPRMERAEAAAGRFGAFTLDTIGMTLSPLGITPALAASR